MMQRRRSLLIVISTVLAVIIVFFVSGSLSAPEGQNSRYQDGETVALNGEIVCLPHRDQDGPQTMECAYGFRADDGTYYQLADTTSDYSLLMGVPMNERLGIKGVYRPSADEKYQQNGKIELTEVNR